MHLPSLAEPVQAPAHVGERLLERRDGHRQFYRSVGKKKQTMDAYTSRKSDVQYHQRCLNMEPRDDSALTEMYARGETTLSVQEVARELLCTHFLYTYTLYGNVIEDFMRGVAETLRDLHGISWSATWTITRFYAPIALKCMMISATGVTLPERLP